AVRRDARAPGRVCGVARGRLARRSRQRIVSRRQRPSRAIIGAMKPTTLLVTVACLAWAASASAQPPPQAPPPPCVDAPDVQFVCGQQGPEDLVVVPGGAWVVTGVFGGTGGINVLRVSDRMSTKAYPSATAKDKLDAKA